MTPIQIFPFDNSTDKRLLDISVNGGDEDWIIIVPPNLQNAYIEPFLGSNGMHDQFRVLPNGKVQIFRGYTDEEYDEDCKEIWEDQPHNLPEYANCVIYITNHA